MVSQATHDKLTPHRPRKIILKAFALIPNVTSRQDITGLIKIK